VETLQAEILRLDQAWAAEREQYLIRQNGEHGPPFVPTLLNSILPALALAGIAAFFIVHGIIGGSSQRYLIAGGLAALGIGLFYFLLVSRKAKAYSAAYARYQQKRAEIVKQIDKMKT
jgi:hypothetical protein